MRKVIKEIAPAIPVVNINNIDPKCIYALSDGALITKIDSCNYSVISLKTDIIYWVPLQHTLGEVISECLSRAYIVYEFETLNEFLEWRPTCGQ